MALRRNKSIYFSKMIVVLLDLFDPLAVVNLFDEIIRFACSNAFGFSFCSFLATVLS